MFEAVERARVEALGANRMPGMADNLTARIEDQYAHGRFAEVTDRDDAPLEDALALMCASGSPAWRRRRRAKALVDVWRPSIEERGGQGAAPASTAWSRTRRASAASCATC